VLRFEANRGKGAAVRAGVLAAAGKRVLFTDADLSTDLAATAEVLAVLEAGAPVGFCSRRAPGAWIERAQGPLRATLGRGFSALARLAGGHALRDVTCGFKGFTREAARELFVRARVDGWAFDAELAAIARARGLEVRELGVVWRDGERSSVRVLPAAARALLDLVGIAARRRRGAWDGPLAGAVEGESRTPASASGSTGSGSAAGPRSLVGDQQLPARPPRGRD
jgi:dolichyl-phosphate beta-glucosyltransferase